MDTFSAFAELIKQRSWYEKSGVLRQNALRDKKKFKSGKLTEKRIKFYLRAAGYKSIQTEIWNKEHDKNN